MFFVYCEFTCTRHMVQPQDMRVKVFLTGISFNPIVHCGISELKLYEPIFGEMQ